MKFFRNILSAIKILPVRYASRPAAAPSEAQAHSDPLHHILLLPGEFALGVYKKQSSDCVKSGILFGIVKPQPLILPRMPYSRNFNT